MVWIEGCQIEVKRYALLDTDFISKTHSVQDDGGNHLIDRVMELPEYEFFCHALTHRVTDYFTVKKISYASQIEPAFCCRYVGDIGDPYFTGTACCKILIQ